MFFDFTPINTRVSTFFETTGYSTVLYCTSSLSISVQPSSLFSQIPSLKKYAGNTKDLPQASGMDCLEKASTDVRH